MTLGSTGKRRILAVDDERAIHLSLRMILADEYDLSFASSAQEAVHSLYSEPVDLLILDIAMPEISGVELLKIVKQRYPDLPVLMLTGNTDYRSVLDAMKAGASDYVVKGGEELGAELHFRIHQTFEKQRLKERATCLERKLAESASKYELIGCSPELLRVKTDILRLKGHRTTVLVTGESGVGKEMVAGTLSVQESDSTRPFVAVNCAAISEHLIESELFGHEKGAFTGAVAKSKGKFLAAHRGDIFLDEIGELPLAAQAKLLRVLQERQVTPVGSTAPIPIDVRVIAATNKDLADEVRAGRFREDLYYRLSVVKINLPPLRDRIEDIPLLTEHFLRTFGADRCRISKSTVSKLQSHSWPGNIRALRNCLERAWIMTKALGRAVIDEDQIQFDHVSFSGATSGIPLEIIPTSESVLSPDHYESYLRWAEGIYFRSAYKAVRENKSRLAERLGFSRDFIHRKLKALKISNSEEWPTL